MATKSQHTLEYTILLRGEDGMEFSSTVTASTHDEARDDAEEFYPESTVLEVMSPADVRAREQDLYVRANEMYDDPMSCDDYDWC